MRIDRGQEHVPLPPEPGERRDTGQREHQDGQDGRHDRVGRGEAGEIADLLDIALLAPHGEDEGERAQRHHQVDQHVDGDAAHTGLAVGGEADQRIAHVADRRIGHQALDVGLADGSEGAERHRGDRDEHDDLLPVGGDRLEGPHRHAHEKRHGGHLRRGGQEGGHRRRRAFIDVGRPHVERHGGDLEGKAGQHEDQAEHQAELALAAPERRGDLMEAGVAGVAVDQRDAVEQHARGQRAEDEVLEAGLGGTQVVAVDRGKHIDRQRLQLEAEIEADHAVGRNHQHHAERAQQDQHRIFELVEALGLGEAHRHDQRHGRADQ